MWEEEAETNTSGPRRSRLTYSEGVGGGLDDHRPRQLVTQSKGSESKVLREVKKVLPEPTTLVATYHPI